MKQKVDICNNPECLKRTWIVNAYFGLCFRCNKARRFKLKLEKGVKSKPAQKQVNKHAKDNSAFYRAIWATKKHECEECGKYLAEYSSTYISHIITRGANTALRCDIRNVRVYCEQCHHRYEFSDRAGMKTAAKNTETAEALRLEYYSKNRKVA